MVCVFARQTSEPLTSLVKSIDSQIAKHSNLKAFVVLLSDDPDATARQLEALAKDNRIRNVPLTVFDGPKEGPPAYNITKDADVTVLLWHGTEVKANHAYAKGGLTESEVKAIVADLPKILKD